MNKEKDNLKKQLLFGFSKEIEKIVSNFFKEQGFIVRRIGIEYRKHYIDNLSYRDIFSPDLKLIDPVTEREFFIEIKTGLTKKEEFSISRKLLEGYKTYYANELLLYYDIHNSKFYLRNIDGLTIKEGTKYGNDNFFKFKLRNFKSLNHYWNYSLLFDKITDEVVHNFLIKHKEDVMSLLSDVNSKIRKLKKRTQSN